VLFATAAAGSSDELVFATERTPFSVAAGQQFTVGVSVEDSSGNVDAYRHGR
jgi:hypothetical protein